MAGIPQFKQTSMIGSTPRESAILSMQQNNEALAKLGKVSGGRKRSKRGGGQTMVQVPVVPMNGLKDQSSGTPQGLGEQITNKSKIILNNQAQSALDSKVTLAPIPSTGGKKNRKGKSKRKGKGKGKGKSKSKRKYTKRSDRKTRRN